MVAIKVKMNQSMLTLLFQKAVYSLLLYKKTMIRKARDARIMTNIYKSGGPGRTNTQKGPSAHISVRA